MKRTLKTKVNLIFMLLLCLAALSRCFPPGGGGEAKGPNAFPIAIIDDRVKINYSDLLNRLDRSGLLEYGGILDSTTYFDTLQSIVIDSVLSILSKEVDIRQDKTIYRFFMMRYLQFWKQYIYENDVLGSFRVDSSDIDSFYRAHGDRYTYREQVRARQLTISDRGFRFGHDSVKYRPYSDEQLDSMAFDMISEIKQRADTGEDFGILAYDYSMHRESGKRYGELGYFFRGRFSPTFDSVAFSLPVFTISDPFRDIDGWHLVQVVDHIDSGMAPLEGQVFELVKGDFLYEITEKRSRELVDSLIQSATFVFNDSALMQPSFYAVADTTWSAIINGRDTVDFFRLGDLMNQYRPLEGESEIRLEGKKQILKKYFSDYLLVQYAHDKKLDKRPEVIRELDEIKRAAARKLIFKDYEDLAYMPDDSTIEDYYQRHLDKFTFSKPVYVQHIIVEDSLFGEYLRDLAQSGLDFMDLAEENYPGDIEIRRAAADLGYIGPGEMPDAFYDAALRIPRGEITHPVKTEFGYHIIKVIDRKYNRQVSEVRQDIIVAIREEHKQSLLNKWRHDMLGKYDVRYDLSKIPTIKLLPRQVRDPDAVE